MSGSGGPGSAQQRISRLERSIGWLQEQHAAMVTALHREIETLKNRNRGTHMFRKCYEIKDVLSAHNDSMYRRYAVFILNLLPLATGLIWAFKIPVS